MIRIGPGMFVLGTEAGQLKLINLTTKQERIVRKIRGEDGKLYIADLDKKGRSHSLREV